MAEKITKEKLVANLVTNELSAKMSEAKLPWEYCPITPQAISDIADMILDDTISHKSARIVIDTMWDEAMARGAAILKDMQEKR